MIKVSVVKCSSYKNTEVRKDLEESLKNINFSFKKGMKILIKPNILSPVEPEAAITTHPVIIEELCKILKKHNAKIFIGESSSYSTNLGFEVSGIGKLKKYGKIINFEAEDKEFFNTLNKKIPLPKILFDVDLIINVPKLKTHSLTLVTLCVKNLYGCIPGKLKENYHKIFPSAKKFSRLLFELHEKIKPQLNIIDGVEGLEGNGPAAAGEKIKSNLIIASKNAIAADIIASEIIGFKPFSIFTNKFSNIKRKDIEVTGDAKDLKLNFKKPLTAVPIAAPIFYFITGLFPKARIKFNHKNCTKCKLCEKKCPVKAIALFPWPECNYKKCIRCLCCIEVCQQGAVSLEEHWTKKFIKKIYKSVWDRNEKDKRD